MDDNNAEHLNMEWVDSVKNVLPDHILNAVKHHLYGITSMQMLNLGGFKQGICLQHLWTGPISNASVDVVQGSRSVEVRAVGVTKGAAIDRILGEIVHSKSMTTPIDYVLCIGHFLGKDEDVYTFFEPELPYDSLAVARTKQNDGLKSPIDRRPSMKLPAVRSVSKSSQGKAQRPLLSPEKRAANHGCGSGRRPSAEKISWNVLDLKGDNYFSCAVGRTRTNARYLLGSSDDVVSFLTKLANASTFWNEYSQKSSYDRSLDFPALCALYAVTDVALVTSLRDGMNLVSYEFVACQDSKKGVLILSEFAGAAQSLGAGAILVNPWNITEVADSIRQALTMSPEEREKRHRHNFVHVTTHTAQEWAETFVSELDDTVIEAQLRTKQVPPALPEEDAISRYLQSTNRLLILGFNATLTEPADTPGRRADQIKEMELKLHPELKEALTALCSDRKTTIVVLSGSDRKTLDDNFGEYDMWLAAEHGMFLRLTKGEWMTTMPEHLNMEWVDSVKHVFEYFTERTPRSHFERCETSLVWNYKYADVEFGRLQARDMLQHLWTGPISNASVDVVQGSRSVEVRAVGVTKGAAIDRILGEIVHSKSMTTPIDYVLCIGHFLGKDEDVYTFFEPELPYDSLAVARTKQNDGLKSPIDRRPSMKLPAVRSVSKSSQGKAQRPLLSPEKRAANHGCGSGRRPSAEKISWNVLDLKGDNYFSCAVGRTRTNARYLLGSSDDVVSFLTKLANAST
ncbi:hypothetical protein NC653_027765 [Populus alba x Populus x berolinensis]|uniref:Uncharacterized protein n=1 Tax=Populus alba x Populus x berolinensis TaxID=444605 RepID=A0AAD6M672_9ROSI|nr:hypothetical protein NC653_027765 [Populus alba x Populus x berolinensis]